MCLPSWGLVTVPSRACIALRCTVLHPVASACGPDLHHGAAVHYYRVQPRGVLWLHWHHQDGPEERRSAGTVSLLVSRCRCCGPAVCVCRRSAPQLWLFIPTRSTTGRVPGKACVADRPCCVHVRCGSTVIPTAYRRVMEQVGTSSLCVCLCKLVCWCGRCVCQRCEMAVAGCAGFRLLAVSSVAAAVYLELALP